MFTARFFEHTDYHIMCYFIVGRGQVRVVGRYRTYMLLFYNETFYMYTCMDTIVNINEIQQ